MKKIKHNGEYQKLKWGEKELSIKEENIVIEGNEEDKKYDIQLYFNDGEIKKVKEAIIDIDEENAKKELKEGQNKEEKKIGSTNSKIRK